MRATESIVRIQDLIAGWRATGYQQLSNGTELYGCVPDDDHDRWLHVVFRGMRQAQLESVERSLGCAVPSLLRSFYRGCGGMSLFGGAFTVAGHCPVGFATGEHALRPMAIVELNHAVDMFGWRGRDAVAFAVNGWDGSVHVAGMGNTPNEVVRCDRVTGRVMERHADVFACVEARLYRLDSLAMQ